MHSANFADVKIVFMDFGVLVSGIALQFTRDVAPPQVFLLAFSLDAPIAKLGGFVSCRYLHNTPEPLTPWVPDVPCAALLAAVRTV